MASRNQERERYYFEKFRQHYQLPSGEVVYSDKPDVRVVNASGGVVGIEITNLYVQDGSSASSEQVQRHKRLAVLKRAQHLHEAAGGRRIEVTVDFSPEHPITDVEKTANALATLALHTQSQSTQIVRPQTDCLAEVRCFTHNAKEYADARWNNAQVHTVPLLQLDRLTDIVKQKCESAKQYLPCDEYWLLVVVEFMDPAQDQELYIPSEQQFDHGPFERILVYKPAFEQVLQVPKRMWS
jgi:hypothetical protein